MKTMLFVFLGLFFSWSPSHAQELQSDSVSNTYAVVVGISKYDNEEIPPLRFAHRDAEVFAGFLHSRAGGSVPKQNIRLLLDSNANMAAVYNALFWLMEVSRKGDLVYIYFAGHGDNENITRYKNGFLLTSNTGPHNYFTHALRIEDLNDFANTLSTENKSRVIIVTDACHSGKLADKHTKAAFLVGEDLAKVKANEIRITACAADQLSNEGESWGGGRGVFSYYLINGLSGLADQKDDKIVTTGEIRDFLIHSFANDKIIKENNLKQTPVLSSGSKIVPLAKVDSPTLIKLKEGLLHEEPSSDAFEIPEQPFDYFFNRLKSSGVIERLNYDNLNSLPTEQIYNEVILQFITLAGKAEKVELLNNLRKNLERNKTLRERFNSTLVDLLYSRGQRVINLILKGDAAELEKRRYYNQLNSGYEVYPKMFALAMQLTDKKNYLYKMLEISKHYFTGVVSRLKVPTVADPTALIAEGFAAQLQAFKLEENAAYIHNELGLLHLLKKELPDAEKYFAQATSISPEWAIPWANLIGIYTTRQEFQKAEEAFQVAKTLQPDFSDVYVNAGFLYEKKGNLLAAEEMYRKATTLNTRHYLPFERLGYVYLASNRYSLSEYFFKAADERKKGFYFEKPEEVWQGGVGDGWDDEVDKNCVFDTAAITNKDVITKFLWAYQSTEARDSVTAERVYRQLIEKNAGDFMASCYLGRILLFQKRFQEAELLLKAALNNYRDKRTYNRYKDSLGAFISARDQATRKCILQKYQKKYFDIVAIHYLLGELYQRWNDVEKSASEYKYIIKATPKFIGGYYKLWRLYEKSGRYEEAEKTIIDFVAKEKKAGRDELQYFYKRMIRRSAAEPKWYHKAGSLLHRIAFENPAGFEWDSLYAEPDFPGKLKRRIYIHEAEYFYHSLGEYFKISLPGTKEKIKQIDASLIPRFYNPLVEESEVEEGTDAELENTYEPPDIYNDFYEEKGETLGIDTDLPRIKGISYLLKADSLCLPSDRLRIDINDKLGDLFNWLSLPEYANRYYEVADGLDPKNSAIKIKLKGTYEKTYRLTSALSLLELLYKRNEIRTDDQLKLVEYYNLAGRFSEAELLLTQLESVLPNTSTVPMELRANIKWMSGQFKEALHFFEKTLALKPKDFNTIYTIARIHAKLGTKESAFKYLSLAYEKGIRNPFVLERDRTWDAFKAEQQWKDLLAKFAKP